MSEKRALSVAEAAAQLGVPPATVHQWTEQLLGERKPDLEGSPNLESTQLDVLAEVKRLRQEGLGFASIRRVIGASVPSEQTKGAAMVARFVSPEVASVIEQSHAANAHVNAWREAFEKQNQMAMQLARFAHLNGQLQVQLQIAQERASQMVQNVTELDSARKEAAELREQLEARDEQLATLNARINELQKPRRSAGLNFPKLDETMLEMQRELIRAKERIAAFEAAEFARSENKRPWWNFWD